jgi:1,4-dihydroxy-2-naphthoate octaprenyltransferase
MIKAMASTDRIKIHLWILPRWFAAPFFGMAAIIGALLAGELTIDSWLGVIACLLIMAGGHAFNSFLDYAWTGLDQGLEEDRSAEKDYTGGQSLIAEGKVSLRGVLTNALIWYISGFIIILYLARQNGWPILLIGIMGMLITFWYSKAKFNWTHELALGIGIGPLPALVGMFATNVHPHWIQGILAGIPFGIMIAFAGLALDEWPDAEANLKKGVKSLAYKVWEYGISLEWYISIWLVFVFIYQLFLILIGIYKPLTGLTFFTWPLFIACVVFFKRNFSTATNMIILVAALYFVLLVIGQAFGS